jgi:hypothetical protein
MGPGDTAQHLLAYRLSSLQPEFSFQSHPIRRSALSFGSVGDPEADPSIQSELSSSRA